MAAKKEKAVAMEPSEFASEVKQLTNRLKSLFRVEHELEKAKKEGKSSVTVEGYGQTIEGKDITALKHALVDSLKHLSKAYKTGYNRRRGRGGNRSGPNSGFRQPIALRPELLEFLKRANFGTDPEGRPVRDQLVFLQESNPLYGIATRAVLTPLLSLYAKVNRLSDLASYNRDAARQREPEFINRQLLGADQLMMDTLGGVFRQIAAESENKLRALGVANGQEKPPGSGKRQRHFYRDVIKQDDGTKVRGRTHPIWNDFYHVFDPRNFAYGNFQSIISHGTYKKVGTPGGLPADDPRASLLAKVPEVLAKAYQDNINSGMDYNAAYTNALRSTGVQEGTPDANSLAVRVTFDSIHNYLGRVLAQYASGKKSSKSSK